MASSFARLMIILAIVWTASAPLTTAYSPYYVRQLRQHMPYLGSTACTNLPPGLAPQILGIDIRKYDPTPWVSPDTDNNTDSALGYKNALFDFTCDQNLTFVDVLNKNVVYQMPDQMATIFYATHGYLNTDYSDFESAEDYRTYQMKYFNADVKYSSYGFNASITYNYASEQQTTEQRTLTTVFASTSGLVGQLQPGWFIGLGRAAQMLVNAMPDNYDDNPLPYCLFVDTFGTHYLDQVILGGVFRTTSSVDIVYKQSSTNESLAIDAGASFGSFVNAHGGKASGNTDVSTEFAQHSVTTESYYGGQQALINNTKFDDWWSSVQVAPTIVGAQLKSIPDILALTVPKKAASLLHAQFQYMNDNCVQYLS